MRPDAIDWSNHCDHVALAFPPRQQFHRIVRRWFVRIVLLQVIVAAVTLLVLQGPWRRDARMGHASNLVTFAAESLAGASLDAGDPHAFDTVHRLVNQPGVSFAVVVDENNAPVILAGDMAGVQSGAHPDADRPAQVDALTGRMTIATPIARDGSGGQHRLIVGIRDDGLARALLDGGIAIAVGCAAVAFVFMPAFLRRLRIWSRGIGHLHAAIRRLAHGARPGPAPVVHDDEVSYLAIAFNDMAGKLLAHQQQLSEANAQLEERVALRTAELNAAVARLEEQALVDALTGLPNRRAMVNGMARMLTNAERTDSDLIVLAIDLDAFKGLNDTLGHAAGDELLQMAAELFRTTCGTQGLAARLGGDEFILLLPLNGCHLARPIAERLIYEFRLQGLERFADANLEEMPSMSIGIASRKQLGSSDTEALLEAADQAMYKAKRLGKSQFHIFDETDTEGLGTPTQRAA